MVKEIIQEILSAIGIGIKENEEGLPVDDLTVNDLNPCPIDDHSTMGIS